MWHDTSPRCTLSTSVSLFDARNTVVLLVYADYGARCMLMVHHKCSIDGQAFRIYILNCVKVEVYAFQTPHPIKPTLDVCYQHDIITLCNISEMVGCRLTATERWKLNVANSFTFSHMNTQHYLEKSKYGCIKHEYL